MRIQPLFLSIALAACGGKSSAPTTTPPDDTTEETTEEVTEQPEEASAPAVVIRYARISWVRDSPEGQMSKATRAVESSGLVAELTGLGVEISYEPDEDLNDELVITADGEEIGRADLRDATDQEAPAELVDAVKTHFAL